MVMVEKSFPRGGIAPVEAKTQTNLVFGATQTKFIRPKKNKAKTDESWDLEDENTHLKSISAGLLSYDTIQDGMNIMGIVKAVDQLYLWVSLPGRMTARISALEISDAYSKATKDFLHNVESKSLNYKSLKDLYCVGQIVYARVLEIQKHPNGRTDINMSLKPNEVHTDLVHTNIKKGFIFNGAIEEVQEHGYIIESGIRGLRTFAPIDKCQRSHVSGELIYLKVEKITHDLLASTCICKELKYDNLKVKNQNDPNLDYMLPGTIVQFSVDKRLKDGLQGTIMNGAFTAYVNEHQLSEPLSLPENYEVKQQLNTRVLYVMPLTKLVYLTLNLHLQNKIDDADGAVSLKKGDVIEKARVHHLGSGGVILVINNKYKGVISYKSIKTNYRSNYDQDELLAKYAKKTKHKVRVLDYDLMDSLYICTDDPKVVEEKVFCLEDLKPGEFVNATVKDREDKIGGYILQIGKIRGIIERLFLAKNSKNLELNSKIRCRVIAVNLERKTVYVTNRSEYLAKNCRALVSLSDAKVNSCFTGTVVKTGDEFVIVKFFNHLKGVLHKTQLSGTMATEYKSFYVGQTMKFRVTNRHEEQITLTLPEDTFKMGEICPIEVVNTLDSGLEIKISFTNDESEEEEFKGLVPIRLLSDFVDLLAAKRRIYPSQSKAEAVCMVQNIFSIRDVDFFRQNLTKEWQNVNAGDVLRAYVKNIVGEVVELLIPVRNYNKLVRVHQKMLRVNAIQSAHVELTSEQVVYVKVLSKENTTKTITVSAMLTDVWDAQLKSTAHYVENYLKEVFDIKQALKKQGAPISKYFVGEKINVQFKGIHPVTNDWLYEAEKTKLLAVLKPTFYGKAQPPPLGHKQECIILWIEYSNDLLLVSHKPFDIAHITNSAGVPANFVGKSGVNAKVLLSLDNIVICSLKKGVNPLVYCPVRLHYNDFENSCSNMLKAGEFCKLAFIHESLPIAVPESIWKLWKNIKRKANGDLCEQVKGKRVKLEQDKEDMILLEESNNTNDKKTKLDSEKNEKKTKCEPHLGKVTTAVVKERKLSMDIKLEIKDNALFFEDKAPNKQITKNLAKPPSKINETSKLPGVTDFWSTDLNRLNVLNAQCGSSDEDDDPQMDLTNQKKKRLSATEKFKQQREEEARLRVIEEKYADPNHLLETVDQFDRLVLADPNNSRNWISYMVLHLQSAEIEKARAVARRALKTISFRESSELINVWAALLNLELRYGSKDIYDETLKEALACNDPLKIYLRTVEILCDVKKTRELIEVIGILTKKFKAEPEVWRVTANAYFSLGMNERAQKLLHHALACLPEREHVKTIVTFANLNHKYSNDEMAQTLLDQVVTSYPKRVDVWTQYVDMLVKSQLIEPARTTLERAVMQKIPLKKMRTLFKKYLEFEERFGNAESVQKVKQQATEFVKNNSTL